MHSRFSYGLVASLVIFSVLVTAIASVVRIMPPPFVMFPTGGAPYNPWAWDTNYGKTVLIYPFYTNAYPIDDLSSVQSNVGWSVGTQHVLATNNFTSYLKFTNNNYVVLSNDTFFSMRAPTNDIPFTVAYCFKVDAFATEINPIGRLNFDRGGWGHWFMAASGVGWPYFSLNSGPEYGNNFARLARRINYGTVSNAWNAFVATYDGSQADAGLKMYWGARRADDLNDNYGTYTGLFVAANHMFLGIGRNTNFARPFLGELANVIISTGVVWSANDVMTYLTNVCTNIGYDFSCGNYLIWSNSVYENTFSSPDAGCDSSFAAKSANATTATYATDKTNSWLTYNGSQLTYIRMNEDTLAPLNSNYAASVWINVSSDVASYGGIIELGSLGGNGYFRLYSLPTRRLVFWCRDTTGGQTLDVSPTNSLELSKWYNVVCVWNGSNVATLYLDNKVIGAATNNSFGQISGLNSTTIGTMYYALYGFKGAIDECRLWRGVDVTPYIGSMYSNKMSRFGR